MESSLICKPLVCGETLQIARMGGRARASACRACAYGDRRCRLREMRRKLIFREALLSGDGRCADVEDELDARLPQRADEGADRPALIAYSANRMGHGRAIAADRASGQATDRSRQRDALGLARIRLAAIFLDAGGAQAGQAVLVDRPLPAQELVDRERVALTGLLEADQPAADRGDDLGLAANNPPLGIPGRQIGDGQGTAVGADHISDAGPIMISHGYSQHHMLKRAKKPLVERTWYGA